MIITRGPARGVRRMPWFRFLFIKCDKPSARDAHRIYKCVDPIDYNLRATRTCRGFSQPFVFFFGYLLLFAEHHKIIPISDSRQSINYNIARKFNYGPRRRQQSAVHYYHHPLYIIWNSDSTNVQYWFGKIRTILLFIHFVSFRAYRKPKETRKRRRWKE